MEIARWLQQHRQSRWTHPGITLILGAPHTGKTFSIQQTVSCSLKVDLADAGTRERYSTSKSLFEGECLALPHLSRPSLVWVDSIHLLPELSTRIGELYDRHPGRWHFVLSGRPHPGMGHALPSQGLNNLQQVTLHPLLLQEYPPQPRRAAEMGSFVECLPPLEHSATTVHPGPGLEERLAFGDLPGCLTASLQERPHYLQKLHGECLETIQEAENLRDWNSFRDFLQLAALHSGEECQYAHLARETGLSQPTIKSWYGILEAHGLGFAVSSYQNSSRTGLIKRDRFFFYDLGWRHVAGGLLPGLALVATDPERWFRNWLGLELWRRLSYSSVGTLGHFRTRDGAKIDYVVSLPEETVVLQARYTAKPADKDTRHIVRLLSEISGRKRGYVICLVPHPTPLRDGIIALPWWMV